MNRCHALLNYLAVGLTLLGSGICPAEESESEQAAVTTYGYKVMSQLRFDRANFTQGLEIFDGRLYVSSGLYGESMIRVYDFPSMGKIQAVPVDSRIFAEGLTVIDNRLVVLSWRERVMLVYSLPDLSLLGQSTLPGQGWGATHSGSTLWFSDGSHYLYSADMSDDGTLNRLPVMLEGRPLRNLNELEWVDGEIWANIWQSDLIVRIDPETGTVTGLIDLGEVIPDAVAGSLDAVPNGIAWNAETGQIYVTGKLWPALYEIRLPDAD